MKFLFLTLFALSFNAEASKYFELVCIPAKPCAYAQDLGGKCITSIKLAARSKSAAVETINYRPQDPRLEVIIPSDTYQVSLKTSLRSIKFSDSTGDQNGELSTTNSSQFKGQITVDQDFEFAVTCQDKSVIYR